MLFLDHYVIPPLPAQRADSGPTDHQSAHQSMSFPDGPLDTQSHSLPTPSQTKHPAHCCNGPGIDTAGHRNKPRTTPIHSRSNFNHKGCEEKNSLSHRPRPDDCLTSQVTNSGCGFWFIWCGGDFCLKLNIIRILSKDYYNNNNISFLNISLL